MSSDIIVAMNRTLNKITFHIAYTRNGRMMLLFGLLFGAVLTVYMFNPKKETSDDYDEGSDFMDVGGDMFGKNPPKIYNIYKNMVRELRNTTLQSIPKYFTQDEKCPACFGDTVCSDVDTGTIKIKLPERITGASRKGVYYGRWGMEYVVIKKMGQKEEYARLDKYVCDAVGNPQCDVKKSILTDKFWVHVGDALAKPDQVRRLRDVAHPGESQALMYTACAGEDLLKKMFSLHDLDGDEKLNSEEKGMLFFSMAVNPEVIFLELVPTLYASSDYDYGMFGGGGMGMLPTLMGICGRSAVLEYIGVPLEETLHLEFYIRADLAWQMLNMLHEFSKGSKKWKMLFHDFDFNNFFVSYAGSLYLVDLEDIIIIDMDQGKEAVSKEGQACDSSCQDTYMKNLAASEDTSKRMGMCHELGDMTFEIMSGLACRNIFSDLPEHKSPSKKRGLLHSPPAEEAEALNAAVQICASTKDAAARKKSVEDLNKLFNRYLEKEAEKEESET